MKRAPTFDDIFAVMAAASIGQHAARVEVPDDSDADDPATRIALALNILLDDLDFRMNRAHEMARELRLSEERYRLMFDNSPLPNWLFDRQTLRILAVNDCAVREYGYSRDEFLAMTIKDLRPPEDIPALLQTVHADMRATRGLWRHKRKDGTIFQVEVTTHSLMVEGRSCRVVVARDVTERTRLEEQLRQAQKMEAIGRLAGGVAHDFNNVLSVILAYGTLAMRRLPPNDPVRDDVAQIVEAGERAADLTRQLLMFSRQSAVEPKVLDLNELVGSMEKMLCRMVGDDVEITVKRAPNLGSVRVDRTSMEQVVMNLVVNARDAMPTGGKLILETADVVIDGALAREHADASAVAHVMLAVTDTGIGMDPATQARIFEPFFTTKERGKGTGLGLATVYGVARQSGGMVAVESAPGEGTTMKVFLPRVSVAPPKTPA